MEWDKCNNEFDRRICYAAYCEDIWYENGNREKPLSYEEWCKESEKLGETLGVYI